MENFEETEPLVYDFHSTSHLYQGLDESDLRLEIQEYGSDALQVKLINRHYQKQKSAVMKYGTFLAVACCSYVWLHLSMSSFRLLYMEMFLVLSMLPLLWRLFSLVELEKFICCYDFGIHLQIQRFMGSSNTFIASSDIHDIRINEVIENLDFRYLLIIRSKGKLFEKRPVIPIFKIFKPTCDCLSLVYKHLSKVMLKEPSSQ